jgi:sugar phosphate permease
MNPHASGGRVWLVWSLIGVAYMVAYFQRVAPQTVLDRLMADFDAGASQIGMVTSAYFYGYMAMQFPAGVMVDRWGVRCTVLLSLVTSALGTFWFTSTSTVQTAATTRALIALGDALIWSSLIKFASQWFPASRFGLVAGLSQLCGYIGGLLATTPLAVLVSLVEWRGAFRMLTYAIITNFMVLLVFLRNHPAVPSDPERRLGSILQEAARALRRSTTWGLVMTYVGSYLTTTSLSGVWGVPLFMQAYDLSRATASTRMFVLMVGYACGAIVLGYLADSHVHSLRWPLMAMGAARMGLLLLIAPFVGMHLPGWIFIGCVAALGFIGGGTIPLFITSLKQTFTSAAIGVAIGLTATAGNLGGGVVQPLLGTILDHHWAGAWVEGVRLYTAEGYTWLLVALSGVAVCAVIGPLFIAEKDCADST